MMESNFDNENEDSHLAGGLEPVFVLGQWLEVRDLVWDK